MLDYLEGKLSRKDPEGITLDLGGMGISLIVPLSTYYRLPEIEQRIKIFTWLYIKEEKISLFGFYTTEERELFKALLGVSSIGPKIALNILSRYSPEDFRKILQKAEVSVLSSIRGIGRKTAQRIILELSDKLKLTESGKQKRQRVGIFQDLINALISLGYKEKLSVSVAEQALETKGEKTSLEILIKEALKHL